MTVLVILVPAALALGIGALGLFLWCLRSEQYADLEGASWRILEDEGDAPLQ